jgi:stress response protein SCP2
MHLAPGQNCPLIGTRVTVTVTGPLDLTALVLSESGVVSGDADMVFFNQPRGSGVVLEGRTLVLDLGSLRPGATRVALVASPEVEGATFGGVGPVTLTASHGGGELSFALADVGSETAMVLCEVYLRAGSWKLRAVGQGYASGLAGVAADFGIEVNDETIALDGARPVPVPTPAVASTPARPPESSAEPATLPTGSMAAVSTSGGIEMQKRPLGSISLSKSGKTMIPMVKADKGQLQLRASLRWTGREDGESDLDLYALCIDESGSEKVVYYKDKGSITKPPFIQLDQDSQGAGEENLTIVAGHHRYVLLCAYSAVGNGEGSFKSYGAHIVIDDGAGSQVTVPLFNENEVSYWVAITLVDFTDPSGARVVQLEQYGEDYSERRPVLLPDGRIEMSKGPIEFK